MGVREKLVELLERTFESFIDDPYCIPDEREFADHLIANGVTVQDNTEISEELLEQLKNAPITILQEEPTVEVVQEWISVKDRTPTEADGTVWVCLADVFPYNEKEPYIDAKHDRRITEAFYSQFSKRWYKDGAVFPDGVVTHWMEKAQPPKGE